jgi:hypothetical protein
MRFSTIARLGAASGPWTSAERSRVGFLSDRPSRWPILIALTCMSAVLVLGCGSGGQKHEARQLENSSILSSTTPLSERLVKQSEIESTSDSAAQRTFLQLWSLLQFEAWDQAEQLFEPGLRRAIGVALLAAALENDLIFWQSTKPRIISARATGGTATISFLARDEQGKVVPTSISFGGTVGAWRVSYFALLNPAIARATQLREQARIDPLGTKPNAEAVRQANKAANLQGIYLERKLGAPAAPAKP